MHKNIKKLLPNLLIALGLSARGGPSHDFRAEPLEYEELQATAIYWREISVLSDAAQTVDDTTWNDLEMDAVYDSLRYTHSTPGDELLYAMLRDTGSSQETLAQRHKMLDAFTPEDHRSPVRTALGKQPRNAYHGACAYLFHSKDKVPGKLALYIALALMPFVLLLLGFFNPMFFIGIVFSFALSLFVFYKSGKTWQMEITSVRHIAQVLKVAKKLLPLLPPALGDIRAEMQSLVDEMKPVARWNALFAMQRLSDMDFLTDYLRIALQLDMICLNQLASFFAGHNHTLRRLYQLVGEVDACQAIAAYRSSGVKYCEPVFDQQLCVQSKGLAHPLIESPIRNDLCWTRGVLITGANASGKSTFTKTMAVNAILAQSILTCTAEQFTLPRSRVMTSMAMRDSLQSGESYFIVEIRSLKRIVDALEQPPIVLCFIDEILRGTNTIERISASKALLQYIEGKNCLCMAATHDLELTKLLPNYRQIHFREDLTPSGMHFSYKLIEGPSDTRNAIALLSLMQFPQVVTQTATDTAAQFTSSGQWA